MSARPPAPAAALSPTSAWNAVTVPARQIALAAATVPALFQPAGTWLVLRDGGRRPRGRGVEVGGPESQKEHSS
jgi:hypothetical protein